MTVKLLTLKPRQDVIADIEEIRTREKKPKIVGYQLTLHMLSHFLELKMMKLN